MRNPSPIRSSARTFLLGVFACALTATIYFGIFVRPLPFYSLFASSTPLVLHLAAFACLTILGLLVWPKPVPVLVVLLSVGGAIEIAHMFDPSREGSLNDLAVDLGGIVLGAMLLFIAKYLVLTARKVIARFTRNREHR